jgi:hypothetical protein
MKRSILALGALMTLSVMANQAKAQCPALPLTALSGTYVFSFEGVWPYVHGMAGTFTASVGTDRAGNPIGLLSLNASSYYRSSYTRWEADAGRYQINPTCTGGTLTFNMSSQPMQFDFWFYGGNKIAFVSTINGRQATGTATRAATACPAGTTNVLSALAGLYTFQGHGFETLPNYAITGVWNATIGADRAGNPIGLLSIHATSNLGVEGSVTRAETDAGRYQISPNCGGGTLTFNLSSRPVQFDFWFAEGFQELVFISTNSYPILGWAKR